MNKSPSFLVGWEQVRHKQLAVPKAFSGIGGKLGTKQLAVPKAFSRVKAS